MPCHTYGDCNLIVVVNYNITLKTLKRRVLHWLQISSHWWLVLGRVTCICTEEKGFGPWKYWGVSFHKCCPSHFKERPTAPYIFTDTFTSLIYHAYWWVTVVPTLILMGWFTILVWVSHFIINNHHTLQTSIQTNDTLQMD